MPSLIHRQLARWWIRRPGTGSFVRRVEVPCARSFVVEEAPGDARDLFVGLRDYGDGHLAETKLTARVD